MPDDRPDHRRRVDRLAARTRRSSSPASPLLVAVVLSPAGVGPLDLRRRRQPRGRPPHRHPGAVGAHLGVRPVRAARRRRRDHHVGPAQRRLADVRASSPSSTRSPPSIIGGASFLGGRGNVGQRPRRRADDRRDPQRHEPAERRRVPAADRHRRGHRAGRRVRRAARPARGALPRAPGGAAHDAPALAGRAARPSASAPCSRSTSVDLDVHHGEVLALLGDNGAGKSTLIKCISGVHRLDAGDDRDRRRSRSTSPRRRRPARHGIETVYQDLALFDNLDPAANFYAGREDAGPRWLPRPLRVLRRRAMADATRRRARPPAGRRCPTARPPSA